MRKKLRMTYIKYVNRKGYMGHWCMDYYVDNVIDVETGDLICDSYVFKESKIFKGMGLSLGDTVELTATVSSKDGNIKITYYKDIKKILDR